MYWASECKKTAMWPGWADSKCLRSCVLGALRTPWQEPVQGESWPPRPPALKPAPHWPVCPLKGGVKGSSAHRSAGAGAPGSPPTRGGQLGSVSDLVLQRL